MHVKNLNFLNVAETFDSFGHIACWWPEKHVSRNTRWGFRCNSFVNYSSSANWLPYQSIELLEAMS